MRPLLAVSWDHHELVCLVASPIRSGLRLEATHHVPLNGDAPFADAARQLAEGLQLGKRSSYALLIALPRTQVEMSRLSLPPAKPDELPLLVRNALSREHAEMGDESLVDYHLMESNDDQGDDGLLHVEAAMVRGETQSDIQTLSTTLGQTPARIVVRYHAVASLFARQVHKLPRASLLLNIMQSAADISVLHDDQIQFTRSIHVTNDESGHPDVGHLSDEIRRTMYVAPQDGEGPLLEARHVYMFADLASNDHLVAELADELDLPVSLLDPLAGVELAGERPTQVHRLAALIGMMWDYVDGQVPIDFANPKRPPPPARVGRKIAIYSIAAVVALVLVGWVLKRDVDQAQQRVATLEADIEDKNELLEKIREKTIVLDAVQQWERNEINWLNELRRISSQLLSAEEAVLQRVTMAPSGANRGTISLSVRVRDPARIADLENALRDARHQVNSQRISAAGASEEEFGVQFETRITVQPAKPETSVAATAGSEETP